MKCNAQIKIGTADRAYTYCQLLSGHGGPHSIKTIKSKEALADKIRVDLENKKAHACT